MPHRLLLVEDDEYLREGLAELLMREGYELNAVSGASAAQQAIERVRYALVLLDIGLPDGNGIALCKRWRAEGLRMPILFLTAYDEEIQIVRGLDAGGNDYVTKPFRMLELLSRIRALLRAGEPASIRRPGIEIDMAHMSVRRDGELIYLTPTEFKLLCTLARNSGQIMTRRLLLESIWDEAGASFIDDNTLSVHIRRLREKVGEERVRTVRGVGYKWEDAP